MTSRNNSRFLSRVHTDQQSLRPHSHKNTLIWRWLQFVVAGDDEVGEVVRALRKRVDMTGEWANRTQMRRYILKSKKANLDPAMVERVLIHMWNLYSQFRDAEKHNTSFDPVTRNVTRNPWKEETDVDPIISSDMSKFLSR